jgi:hypothetical protein
MMGLLALPELRGQQEELEALVLRVLLELLVSLEMQGLPVSVVLLDQLVLLVGQAELVALGEREEPGVLETLELLE